MEISAILQTMIPIDPLAKIFREQPLFSALTNGQRKRVKQGVQLLNLEENQTLFDTKHQANRFFVVRRGRVKLFRLSPNGLEKIIEIVRPNESFAAAVMFMEQKTYPVCATTLTQSQLFSFENRIFLNILRESPETCFRVMAEMSRRLRQQVGEIDQLSLRSAPTRLATYLVEKRVSGNSSKVLLDAPKHVIASKLSIQPETFSRALGTLSKQGIIRVDGGTIEVLDLAILKDLADGNKNACVGCQPD